MFTICDPADQMSDKSGFDIWGERHLKPDWMIFGDFYVCMKTKFIACVLTLPAISHYVYKVKCVF